MSWSYYGIGRALAVAAAARKRLAEIKCIEPEQTIKQAVGDILALALNAFPADTFVEVEAGGSMHSVDGGAINSLSIKITPKYGVLL